MEHENEVLSSVMDLAAELIGKSHQPTRKWILRRKKEGFSTNQIEELQNEGETELKKMFRMNPEVVEGILYLVMAELGEPCVMRIPYP